MSYGSVNKSRTQDSMEEATQLLGASSELGRSLLTEPLGSYGGRQNPYDQRGDGGAPSGRYNDPQAPYPSGGASYNMPQAGGHQYNPSYNQPSMGRDNYGQNVEMAPLTQNGGSFGRQADPNAILNDCKSIDESVVRIEADLKRIRECQQRSLDDPDSSTQSATNRDLDGLNANAMAAYRELAGRIKAIKQQPESGSPKNAPQVGKVDRRLKSAIHQYQNMESDFRRKLQDQTKRQYLIVRPDATAEDLQKAVEDTSNQQIFSQALLQSDRRGQSQAALAAVENRHVAIQKIEGQMIELAQLFQDMEALVVQQEAAVTVIEQKGEEVVENMDQGNQQIGTAIVSARARNRKKWWCLLIVVILLIVIAVIIVLFRPGGLLNHVAKRSLLDDGKALHARYVTGDEWTGEKAVTGSRSVAGRFFLPG